MRTKMGVGVKCDRVGVLAFHRSRLSANPWIYPWEATYRSTPQIYLWEVGGELGASDRTQS